MTGVNRQDFKEADKILAKQNNWFKSNGEVDWRRAEKLRTERKLTWHHHEDGTTMQLIPADLNSVVPHTGGASKSRK